MSLTVPDTEPRRRGPLLLAVAAALVLALLVGLVYALTRPGDDDATSPPGAAQTAQGSTSPTRGSPELVQYRPSPSQQPLLPYSETLGPRSTEGGVASGFAHTEQGAAMAVQHAIYEVAGTAPPAVFEETWATRWVEVPAEAVTRTQQSYASYAATSGATFGDYLTAPAGIGLFQGYLVDAGDGTTDAVSITTVVLNQALPDRPEKWSGSRFDVRWIDDDWVVVYSDGQAIPYQGRPAGMKVL